jgi:pimeloyl-ACP methyl ester carboxylesterase
VTPEPRTVQTPDGRELRVREAGDPDGPAVLIHHGTPGDGLPFGPWAQDAAGRGIRLIGYDRPGYGTSTPHPGRRVADAAGDAAAIADALGIGRFATWGISGGGPHALACAALLPDRVVAAASLAAVAPFDAHGLNLFAGMGRDNWVEFGAALQGREALEALLSPQAEQMVGIAPADLAGLFRTLVSPVDQDALDCGLAEHLAAGGARTFAQGAGGWVDDDLAFVEPWGFDVAAVGVPVLVWHGRHDRFVPVAHGEWLAARIPGAEARISDEDGHLTLLTRRVPEVHAWLVAQG